MTEAMKQYSVPVANEKELAKIKTLNESDLATVKAFEITNDERREGLRELGKSAQARGKMIEALTASGISVLFTAHKQLKAEQNDLVVPTKNIVQIVKDKLGTYDKKVIEDKRQIELEKAKKDAEAHTRRITMARKKVDGLLEGVTDLTHKRNLLAEELEGGVFTEDEAEVMREQIGLLDSAIANKKEKVEIAAVKVEEKEPVMSVVSGKAKPTGYEIEITDPVKLAQAIAESKAPAGLIVKWNEVLLKQLKKSGQEYPGVNYKPVYKKARL